MRLPLSEYEGGKASQPIRLLRETARHVRALYDILTKGDYNYNQIYKGMALGAQTDKSFAVNGSNTYKYLRHERLNKPALPRDVLHQIIMNGGEHELKPERRFDAAVLNYHLTNRIK